MMEIEKPPLCQQHNNNDCGQKSLKHDAEVSGQNYDEKWDLCTVPTYFHKW